VSPSLKGEGSGKGAVPPSPKIFFSRFLGQNGVFSETLGAKFRFFYDQKSIEMYSWNTKTATEIDLHAIERYSKVSIPLSPWNKFLPNSRRSAASVDGVKNGETVSPSLAD